MTFAGLASADNKVAKASGDEFIRLARAQRQSMAAIEEPSDGHSEMQKPEILKDQYAYWSMRALLGIRQVTDALFRQAARKDAGGELHGS